MAIPTVALSEVQAAPQIGTRLNPGTYMATGGAIAQAGEALQRVGGIVAQVAMEKQKHVNEGILAAEELLRRSTLDQVEMHIAENQQSPEKWQEFAFKTLDEYNKGRAKRSESWGQDVKTADAIRANDFVQNADAALRLQVAKAQVVKANAQKEALAQNSMARGNIIEAHAIIDGMNLNDAQRQQMLEKVTYNAVTSYVMQDPLLWEKTLKEQKEDGTYVSLTSSLNPTQRASLIQTAESRAGQVRAETVNGLLERKFSGELINEDELSGLMDEGRITAKQAKQLVGKKVNIVGAPDILDRVINYDVSKDKGLEQWAALKIEVSELPDGLKTAPNKRLDEVYDNLTNPKKTTNTDVKADLSKQLDFIYKSGVLNSAGYNSESKDMVAAEVLSPNGGPAAYVKLQDDLDQWLKDNPTASREEGNAKLLEWTKSWRRRAAGDAILPAKKTSAQVLDEILKKNK